MKHLCGLVWSSTSTKELQESIRKRHQNANNPADPAQTENPYELHRIFRRWGWVLFIIAIPSLWELLLSSHLGTPGATSGHIFTVSKR